MIFILCIGEEMLQSNALCTGSVFMKNKEFFFPLANSRNCFKSCFKGTDYINVQYYYWIAVSILPQFCNNHQKDIEAEWSQEIKLARQMFVLDLIHF